MAQLPSAFNADEVEDDSFDPIPAAWYPMELSENRWVDSKNNSDNKFIECKMKIVGEEYNGRLIWVRLNLVNSNEKAVSIANKELSRLTKACNLINVDDVDELMNITFEGKVAVTPENANYPAGNEIKGYRVYAGAAKLASKPSADAKSETATKKKPWEK